MVQSITVSLQKSAVVKWFSALHRFRLVNADACHTDCVQLLRSPAADPQYPPVRQSVGSAVVRRVARAVETGLRQRDSGRPSGASVGQASVRAQRGCATGLRVSQVRPRYAAAAQPSLAACTGACYVSARGVGVSLPEWSCATVSRRRTSPIGWRWVALAAAFSIDCGAGRPGHSALYNRRPCVPGCSCSSLERPPTTGDVIVVACGFPAASEDGTFHSVVRPGLTLTRRVFRKPLN